MVRGRGEDRETKHKMKIPFQDIEKPHYFMSYCCSSPLHLNKFYQPSKSQFNDLISEVFLYLDFSPLTFPSTDIYAPHVALSYVEFVLLIIDSTTSLCVLNNTHLASSVSVLVLFKSQHLPQNHRLETLRGTLVHLPHQKQCLLSSGP